MGYKLPVTWSQIHKFQILFDFLNANSNKLKLDSMQVQYTDTWQLQHNSSKLWVSINDTCD